MQKPARSSQHRPFFFVIMPFKKSSATDRAYRAIQAVADQLGYDCYNLRDHHHDERITDAILDRIREAQLVIADLSGERPNCYYELGYAHAYGKTVVPLISKRSRSIKHFDVQDFEFIEYLDEADLSARLAKRVGGLIGRADVFNRREHSFREPIRRILEAAVTMITHPGKARKANLRAYCWKAVVSRGELHPLCRYDPGEAPATDMRAYPYEGPDAGGMVIAEAYNERRTVKRNLSRSVARLDQRRGIPPLRSVLAAPICDFENSARPCWGVVAFDSTRTLQAARFEVDTAEDFANQVARTIYSLLHAH